MDLHEYCIIIPCYNSEKTLPVLVGRIREISRDLQIIVVDDGSADNTANSFTKDSKIEILRLKVNRGKGEALRQGIKRALSLNISYGIFIDSDLQHDPGRIPDFIKLHQDSGLPIIMGKRDLSVKKMPFLRILSNRMTSAIISFRTGKKVSDSQCGFRLLDLHQVQSTECTYGGFQYESELLIKLLVKKCSLAQIDIPTIYGKEKSSIKNVSDTLKFIKLFIHCFFWKYNRRK